MKKPQAHFPKIPPIAYEGPKSENPLSFRHYNPAEIIVRPWESGQGSLAIAQARMDAAFEFFVKIQAPFWCFHDRDIAPEGRSLAESNRNLDRLVAHAKQLQKATGMKLLWGTANLFSHPRLRLYVFGYRIRQEFLFLCPVHYYLSPNHRE